MQETVDPRTDGERSWVDAAAFLVSAITSPFLVTTVTAAVVAWLLHPTLEQIVVWAGVMGTFGAFIPFGVVFVLWRTGRVTDMHVAVREQRALPFAAAIVSVIVGLTVLYQIDAPPQVLGLGAAFVANGTFIALITLHWKISVHAATYAACAIALALVGSPQYLAALGALPLVFWARHHRGRHTIAQGVVPVLLVSAVTPAVYLATVAAAG